MKNKSIINEWWEQFLSPWKHSSFKWYFWGFVVAIGCIGIYPSLYRFILGETTFQEVAENIITYSLALIMPACVPILLSYYKIKQKVSLIVCSLICFVFLPIALVFLTYFFQIPLLVFPLLALAWFSWIVANHDNVDLIDETYNDKIKKETQKNHGANW